jgi:hypothetical protein
MGAGVPFPHSPPFGAKVKNAGSYTPMIWCLIKHKDNFTMSLKMCTELHFIFRRTGTLIRIDILEPSAWISTLLTLVNGSLLKFFITVTLAHSLVSDEALF